MSGSTVTAVGGGVPNITNGNVKLLKWKRVESRRAR